MKNFYNYLFGVALILISDANVADCAALASIEDDGHNADLILGGGNFVRVVDTEDLCDGYDYSSNVIWEFDVREAASIMGISRKSADHVDECKPIDNKTKILITSSYNWCVIVDYATKNVDFWTTSSSNAHSAEVLPSDKLVVACSNPGDALQIYDRNRPNEVLFSVEFPSAHGVVWNAKRQRLYATGKQRINIYSLINADSNTPKLILEKSVRTPKSGTHDLSAVDEDTLIVSGQRAYFFNMDTEKFSELKRFSESTSIKSLNYNAENGECWFTDSTDPEGDYSWSTQTCRHTSDVQSSPGSDDFTFTTPDINLYKVRVLNWNNKKSELRNVEDDESGYPVEYYNLQGMKLSAPGTGFCICIRNGKYTKRVLKRD